MWLLHGSSWGACVWGGGGVLRRLCARTSDLLNGARVWPQLRQRHEADQAALRELRMGMRDVTLRLLRDRRWKLFAGPGARGRGGVARALPVHRPS